MSSRFSSDPEKDTSLRDPSPLNAAIQEKNTESRGSSDLVIGTDVEKGPGNSDDSNAILPTAEAAGTETPGDDIPNGGLVAWLQVLGAFFILMNSWSVFAAVKL